MGKGQAKRAPAKLIGFTVQFSGQNPDTGRANTASNYTLMESEGSGKKGHLQTVIFTPGYDPSTNSVNLIISGKHTFSHGGTLTVIPATPVPDPHYRNLVPMPTMTGIASGAALFVQNGQLTVSPDLLTGTTSWTIGHDGKNITPSS
jgi:hypothetical protein